MHGVNVTFFPLQKREAFRQTIIPVNAHRVTHFRYTHLELWVMESGVVALLLAS